MVRKAFILPSLFFLCSLQLQAQVQREGWVSLNKGDTLSGTFRHKAERIFNGVAYRSDGGAWVDLPTDSVERAELDGTFYRSIFISEDKAGVAQHSLVNRVEKGRMSMFRGRYASRSCSCQDLPSVRKGVFLLKEEEGELHLVRKNKWLDRIKNADAAASAFLPFDTIAADVKERKYAFSEIGKAVKRYNERSKELTRSRP